MIHKFQLNGYYIALDVNSGSVHVLDELAFILLDYYRDKPLDEIAGLLAGYKPEDIRECHAELRGLQEQGLLYSEDKAEEAMELLSRREPVVKALCLHMAHCCNLSCVYCFAGDGKYNSVSRDKLMSFETGRAAIDFLVKSSGNRRNLEVDFFGGEPLLAFDAVKRIVEYARSIEEKAGKNFRFTVTTNGLLLDDEKLDFINKNMHNIVLSIDGRKSVNDVNRRMLDGSSCYDSVMPVFLKTAESRGQKGYYARGTFTAGNLDFADDVLHLADLGLKQVSVEPVVGSDDAEYTIKEAQLPAIKLEYERLAAEMVKREREGRGFNFFHFMVDLSGGPCLAKRVSGCGAGSEYLAVSPDGEIYPCHQLTGTEGFSMGNVRTGVLPNENAAKLAGRNVYALPECRVCFAKYYCSGGCGANAYKSNGLFGTPGKVYCELQRKRLECALMIKAAQ